MGEGLEILRYNNQEGIWRQYFKGGRRAPWGHVEKSNVAVNIDGYRVAK